MAINPNFNDGVSQGSHPRGIVGQSNKSIITRINELEAQRKDTGSLSRSNLASTSTEKLNNSPIIGQKERIRAAQEADLEPGLIKVIKFGGTGASQIGSIITLQDRSIIALVIVNIFNTPSNEVIFGEGDNAVTITTNVAATCLVKYSPNGEFLWVKPLLDAGGYSVYSYVMKNLVAGFKSFYYVGIATGNNRILLEGIEDIALNNTGNKLIIVKFDLNGNYLWHKIATGSAPSLGIAGACDIDDNLYFHGSVNSGTLTFFGNNYTSSSNNGNGLIGKLSSDGETLYWFKVFTHTARSRVASIDILKDGNIIAVGDYRTTVNFGNGLSITPISVNDDNYVLKLRSTDGTPLWVKKIGGVNDDNFLGVAQLRHDSENFIAVSRAGNNIIFPNGVTTTGTYIIAFNSLTGEFKWKNSYPGGIQGTFINDLQSGIPLYNNRIAICGNQTSGNDLVIDGITLPGSGVPYGFFGAHDPLTGELLWIKKITSNAASLMQDLKINTKGKIVVAGHITGDTTFGEGEANETTITTDHRIGFIAIYNQY